MIPKNHGKLDRKKPSKRSPVQRLSWLPTMCCVYLQCYFYIQILNDKEMYSVLCIVGADYVLVCCADLSGREIKRLGSQINYELQKGFELVCIKMLLNVTFVACVFPVWMFPFCGMVFEHCVWFVCLTLLWRIIHWSHDSLVLILCFCTHFLLAPPRNHHLSYIMQLLAMNQICTLSSSMFLI